MLLGDRVGEGLLVVRCRRRVGGVGCAVGAVLVPRGRSARSAVKHVWKHSGADHLIRCGGLSTAKDGFVPAPQLGPILTWKPVARPGVPAPGDLNLSLGEVQLF